MSVFGPGVCPLFWLAEKVKKDGKRQFLSRSSVSAHKWKSGNGAWANSNSKMAPQLGEWVAKFKYDQFDYLFL